MSSIDHINLGWIIGMIEGEGHIGMNGGGGNSPILEVTTTDEDIAIRVATIFELMTDKPQSITQHTNLKSNQKEVYRVRAHGEKVRQILLVIIPHLGYRRRKRAWQVLNNYRELNLKLGNILTLRKINNV